MQEKTKKIISWIVIIILAALLFTWWIDNLQKRLANFESGQFIDELNFPEMEIPQIPELPTEQTENNGQQNNQTE